MMLAAVVLSAWQAAAASGPVVALETSLGRITVALDRAKAPLSVDNFLSYVRARHYDGTIFHRVIPRFMIQGGGMDASMKARPTRAPVKNESTNGLSNRRGTIAMARTAHPDSATAQFYINLVDNAGLDGRPGAAGYTVFGEVTEGMEVVDRIATLPTTSRGGHQDVPQTAVLIKTARIVSGAPAAAPARPRPKASPTSPGTP